MSELQDEIVNVSKNGKIACSQALEIAKRLEVPTKEVGTKIDELGFKIQSCQLGCF